MKWIVLISLMIEMSFSENTKNIVVVDESYAEKKFYYELGMKLRKEYAAEDYIIFSWDCGKSSEYIYYFTSGSTQYFDARLLEEKSTTKCVNMDKFVDEPNLPALSFLFVNSNRFKLYLGKIEIADRIPYFTLELQPNVELANTHPGGAKVKLSEFLEKITTEEDDKFYWRLYISIGIVGALTILEVLCAYGDIRKALRIQKKRSKSVYHKLGENPV